MELRKVCQDVLQNECARARGKGADALWKVQEEMFSGRSPILTGLINRLENGTKEEVQKFIESTVIAPIGIQSRLVRALSPLVRGDRSVHCHHIACKIICNTAATHLLSLWRSGAVSKVHYFSLVNAAAARGELSLNLAEALSRAALSEGGYYTADKTERCQLFDTHHSVDFSLCSLSDLCLLRPSPAQDLTLLSYGCAAARLTCDDDTCERTEEPLLQRGLPCASHPDVLWLHQGGGASSQGLSVVSVSSSSSGGGGGAAQQLLLIGDEVSLPEGVLDVDSVLSVDARAASAREVLWVSLLVDGRLVRRLQRCASGSSDCDGGTELGGAEADSNSDGSDNEGLAPTACVIQARRLYYCLSAVVSRGIVRVVRCVPLQDALFKDQIPIQVLQLSQELSVVSGTNGLLATVHQHCTHLLPADSSALHPTSQSGPLTHAADATVSAVVASGDGSLLASGDSHGSVCLWRLEPTTGAATLHASPFSTAGSGKVCSLQLSPSGQHLAVGLWDRLILLVVSQRGGSEGRCLYVRSNLDVTMNNIAAKYCVLFGAAHLRVWRVIESPTGPCRLRTSTWLHPNLDHLDHRLARSDGSLSPPPPLPTSSSSSSAASPALLAHRSTPSLATPCDSEPMHLDSPAEANSSSGAAERLQHALLGGEFIPHYKRSVLRFGSEAASASSGCSSMDVEVPTHSGGETAEPWGSRAAASLRDIYRPLRGELMLETSARFLSLLRASFLHDGSARYQRVRPLLVVYCACFQPPTLGLLSAALDMPVKAAADLINGPLSDLLREVVSEPAEVVTLRDTARGLNKWLCSPSHWRVNRDFWSDISAGHNALCALYLKLCGNKSVAMEHPWQDYLRTHGSAHLRRCSRGLRALTVNIRKIDETANIKHSLPHQIGYIVGLQEIYARRVGLGGRLPAELGELTQLRVLSMGNNRLWGELPASMGNLRHLQRIVLHQNNLQGAVPASLGELGCIVNLAGNPRLEHGEDVPPEERAALVDLFAATKGPKWSNKSLWCTASPVSKWYKVGVLGSHVHSIVMSSNGMEGRLPASIGDMTHLRMIELATMPGLVSPIPRELCNLTTLRRLCICRCGLTGRIPPELGQLVGLEELQLFGNQLSGSIPASIGSLTSLKLLSFGEYTGGNNFAPAPLPACLVSLVNLEALFMANCNLTGPLPAWIGNLKELRQLDLQRNSFSGPLPASIGQLGNLLYLNIKDNEQLGGKLPVRELMGLTRLNRLSLVHCSFSDTDADIDILRNHLPRCKIWV